MKKSIFRSIALVALTVFVCSLMMILGVLYDYYSGIQVSQLTSQTNVIARALETEGLPFLEDLDSADFRITWIQSDGSVRFDTSSDPVLMENHLDRAEIRAALENGEGISTRYSTTLMEKRVYAAKRLSDGSVLRLSIVHLTAFSLLIIMFQPIAVLVIFAAVLSLLLASRLSKRIVQPLNRLDPDQMQEDGYEELLPLTRRLSAQQKQLTLQESALKRKQEEFNAATYEMHEGIVLLNEQGEVISINRAAARLLNVSRYCAGETLTALCDLNFLPALIRKALHGEHAESRVRLGECACQLDASPIRADGAVSGAALVIFDVSEKEQAEQMRREFTANVSHELKTPLQTISGSAELLKNGMVQPDDIPRFSGRIFSEAHRMISLVDDVIRLSRLNEGAEDTKREEIDLTELSRAILRELQPKADETRVSLELSGERAVIEGIPTLIRAIVFNLVDNAIKYNREGGSVHVSVVSAPREVTLTIRDTGIGIPEAHQARVFERFYRVDKSHSHAVGGTGLGLSIVKHAAKLHKADISLFSIPGSGTSVTVRFPVMDAD